jgi:phage-related protein
MTGTLAASQREFGVIVDEVQDTVGAAFMHIAEVVLPIFIDAFTVVSDWVASVIPTVQATLTGFLDSTSGGMAILTDAVLPALGSAFEWLTTNIVPPLQSIFQTWAENVLPALQRAFAFVQGWISDNWPLISKVVGQVAGFVKSAMDAVGVVFKAVMPVITKVADVAFPLVGAAASVLLEVLSAVFDAIGTIWQTAWDLATAVADGIGNAFEGLRRGIKVVWDGITGIVRGAINVLIDAVNGMIRALNGIQVHIPRVGVGDVAVGPFDWNGLNLSTIPRLASGARDFAGGWAMLGERGPELARLPAGTDVYSAAQTRDLLAGSGRAGPLIGTQTIVGVQAGDVERETRRALRRAALAWSLGGT